MNKIHPDILAFPDAESFKNIVADTLKLAVKKGATQAEAGLSVSQLHLKNLFPFNKELGSVPGKFDTIIVPELNNGQLSKVLTQEFSGQIVPLNKIQGLPFRAKEIFEEIKKFA